MDDGMGGGLFGGGVHGIYTDAQLLDRFVAAGAADAFEAIVLRHGSMVWGVCRRILRDRHDPEDAFQATFLVLAGAAQVSPREKLGNWLHGVARRAALIKASSGAPTRFRRADRGGPLPRPSATDGSREPVCQRDA